MQVALTVGNHTASQPHFGAASDLGPYFFVCMPKLVLDISIYMHFMLHCHIFTEVGFSLPVRARSMNPCIVIVLDILNKHAP